MKTFFNIKNINNFGVLIIAVILILNLFVIKIGVEDNGSLAYDLKNLGLYDVNAASGSGYYSPVFGIENTQFNYTAGNLIYSVVKAVASFIGVNAIFVYIPAVIYFSVFLLGIYLLLKILKVEYNWSNELGFVLVALILCDSGYIAYFNTPYPIAVVIAFFPLFIYSVLNLAKNKTYKALILELVCSLIIFSSNIVFSVVGVLYGVYSLRFFCFNKSVLWKILSIAFSVLILVSNFAVITSYRNDNSLYNACFYGTLLEENDASKLGLGGEFDEFIGIPSFEDNAQKFINSNRFAEFKSVMDYGDVTGFYVKNPTKFFKNVKSAVANGAVISIPYLGTRPTGTGAEPKSGLAFWNLYSMIKMKLFPANLIVVLVLLVVLIFFSFEYRKNYSKTNESKTACELLALGALGTLVSLVTTIIIFGMVEISFNLSVFNLLVDLCLVFSAVGGTRLLFYKRSALKEKYGVNQ